MTDRSTQMALGLDRRRPVGAGMAKALLEHEIPTKNSKPTLREFLTHGER